jgi:hypothetical protein
MSKTKLTLLTALGLVVLSGVVFLLRRSVLGDELLGPRGASAWEVTVEIKGVFQTKNARLKMRPAPDFRRQHVYAESFQSAQLTHRVIHSRDPSRREIVWRLLNFTDDLAFQASYSFRCTVGLSPPTRGMVRNTRELGAPPVGGELLRAAPRIESEHKEIAAAAGQATADTAAPKERLHALYELVHALPHDSAAGAQSARECLLQNKGSALGKSRLLTALCRNTGIPARVMAGLVLTAGRQKELHYWVEAWVNEHWLPMCPTFGHFGLVDFPADYLVLLIGDVDLVRAEGATAQPRFVVERLDHPANDEASPRATGWRQVLSFYNLPPGEQQLVKFLLLLPLAALIVSIFRTMIGIPTFGTFAPALMGMAFLDLKVLPLGLALFLLVVLSGWGLRHLLDRYHLLLVPRLSALLTLIVILLIVAIVAANSLELAATDFVALFPLVILTHLVERFWTVEAEDSTAQSFKTLLGTFVVAVVISAALSPDLVGTWMFRYPETLGTVLAGHFLVGRYTGYRLTELYRFQDLLQEPQEGGKG